MGSTPDLPEPGQGTKKRSRLPLKQRRLAHHKNGAVCSALAAVVAVCGNIDPASGHSTLVSDISNSQSNPHIATLQRTVSRLSAENTTLRENLCKINQKYEEITTAHEIQESYTNEVQNIIQEKLKHSELQQALHEEKKAMEEIVHFTRQVVVRDMTDIGITNPEQVLDRLLKDHHEEQKSLHRQQEKIELLEAKISQLQKSEQQAILRASEVLREREAMLANSGDNQHQQLEDTSRLNAHISYRQYRSHLEVFRQQNKDLKRQVAQLQWQLQHPSELDYDDGERLTPDSPVAAAVVEENDRRLDDLMYHLASLIEQLTAKETELHQQSSQIATFVVNLRTAQSECASSSKKITSLEEQLQISEEEKIRLQRRLNKMESQSAAKDSKVTSTGEIPDALVRQNIELKEERELLLQENALLKRAWQELPAEPVPVPPGIHEETSQSTGWASWGATKARDLSGMFLNPSYIRQATRYNTNTVPAASVPSMSGPESPITRPHR
eukprot:TRINITY_DN1537_c11_g1_i2.p1 TRINITY_DN1537_c11_g1~~TRINITY_DN1537_c11_g1_i2.p1  ORF type:complete len:499 (+),score=118.77 TRINITY_DN1537_c11_g1_i2:850-2346(+)